MVCPVRLGQCGADSRMAVPGSGMWEGRVPGHPRAGLISSLLLKIGCATWDFLGKQPILTQTHSGFAFREVVSSLQLS